MSDLALKDPNDPNTWDEELHYQNGGVISDVEALRLRRRIIITLKVYPRISPSMLQVALNPTISARTWRPILEDLVREGIVVRLQETQQSESGRWRTAIILTLSPDYLEAERIEKELEEQELEEQAPSQTGVQDQTE